MNGRLRLLLKLLSVGSLMVPAVFAHELDETSSQIILRDGQVEVRIYVNTEHWIETLQDPVAWLTGDSDYLTVTSSNEENSTSNKSMNHLNDALIEHLLAEIHLELDAISVTLEPISQVALQEADDVTEYRFAAKHSIENPSRVSVRFPKSLGDVHISVVRPNYGLVPAGKASMFTLTGPSTLAD